METSLQKNTGANGRATVPLRMLLERAEHLMGGREASIAQQRGMGSFRERDFSAGRQFGKEICCTRAVFGGERSPI